MNCMRCGKETEEKNVFCSECLEDMAKYPVKPGTLIHIPSRPESDSRKNTRKRRELSAEEQLDNAKNAVQILLVTVLGLFGMVVVLGLLLLLMLGQPSPQPEETQPPMGRNYTIITPADQ